MSAGQVVRLPDRNHDGLSDGVEVIASGIDRPHGLEFYDGYLYIASGDRVQRMQGPNQNGNFSALQLVTDNIPPPSGHSSRTIHFGSDGKMYVSAGSSCNVCEETDPRPATIMRFNPDGSIPADNPFANDPDIRKRPVFAWGLRNSVDFLWSPLGQLWSNHNGSDGLGDDLPPEEIVIPVQMNKSHGWPYCYTPGVGVVNANEIRDDLLALPSGSPVRMPSQPSSPPLLILPPWGWRLPLATIFQLSSVMISMSPIMVPGIQQMLIFAIVK
jgi:glucose/arabinose dehydrogenase